MPDPRPPIGPDRVLLCLYGVFVVAAGARSVVQLTLHAHDALLAYTLSAVAALVYVVGFVLVLLAARGRARRAATSWCTVELAGVLAVGAPSTVRPDDFPDATVWSHFGSGYLFVPLLLPIAALLWLRPLRRASAQEALGRSRP